MSIQRYDEDFDAADNTIGMSRKEGGKWCKHDDHLKAMKDLEERMLRFAEWLLKNNDVQWIILDKSLPLVTGDVKDAFQYWKENVEDKK